jgi:hypothetical protein
MRSRSPWRDLQAAPIRDLPDAISDAQLRQALRALVDHGGKFVKVERLLPG